MQSFHSSFMCPVCCSHVKSWIHNHNVSKWLFSVQSDQNLWFFFFFGYITHHCTYCCRLVSHTHTSLSTELSLPHKSALFFAVVHKIRGFYMRLFWFLKCGSVSLMIPLYELLQKKDQSMYVSINMYILTQTCARCCSSLCWMSCRACVCVLALRQVSDGGWDRQDRSEPNTLSASSFPSSEMS